MELKGWRMRVLFFRSKWVFFGSKWLAFINCSGYTIIKLGKPLVGLLRSVGTLYSKIQVSHRILEYPF